MLRFGTKAETLRRLEPVLKTGRVLPQFTFTVGEWRQDEEAVCRRAEELFGDRELIARSSAQNEDTESESQAGKYESVPGIASREQFVRAVNRVAASYGQERAEDQVLVQPMLKDVAVSGVAFSLDPNTGGNYYVVNYDDQTGSTSSVTSGTGRDTKLFYCFKNRPCPECQGKDFLERVFQCMKELERLFGQDNLDLEFAADTGGALYVLQVRPLCMRAPAADLKMQERALLRIYEKVKRENRPKPFLNGRRTVYGVMPDWNPAEIIGIRPKPLALSLYREIITDNIWAYQRDNYGYKNLRSFPLMVDFCGLPYIDVRVSFNSFVPKALSAELSEKLTDYYLDRLAEDPAKHDKVEFEIVFTCYTLDLPERIQTLRQYGFSGPEVDQIVDALRKLTNEITDNDTGLWRKDYEKIRILEKRYFEVEESDLDPISKIYWLLEDCKRYGTLPFAGLARAGFIAVQILKSMIAEGVISEEEYQDFMREVHTVSSDMSRDLAELPREAFLKKYGHLRPGTYDLNSSRYDEAPELYFDWTKRAKAVEERDNTQFKLTLRQMRRLKELLTRHGLADDVLSLFDFIKTAIEGREYAKFIFTRSLSRAMQLFGEMGLGLGFSKEDCAYAQIDIVRNLYLSTADPAAVFADSIKTGRSRFSETESLILPPVITGEQDVYAFAYPAAQPNYITMERVAGEICEITDMESAGDLKGKIVLIPNADPGYDWIFSRGIKGFITKWGGVNSHMAIRAGEMGIPAVIGVGEPEYKRIREAGMIEINAMEKKVDRLR